MKHPCVLACYMTGTVLVSGGFGLMIASMSFTPWKDRIVWISFLLLGVILVFTGGVLVSVSVLYPYDEKSVNIQKQYSLEYFKNVHSSDHLSRSDYELTGTPSTIPADELYDEQRRELIFLENESMSQSFETLDSNACVHWSNCSLDSKDFSLISNRESMRFWKETRV